MIDKTNNFCASKDPISRANGQAAMEAEEVFVNPVSGGENSGFSWTPCPDDPEARVGLDVPPWPGPVVPARQIPGMLAAWTDTQFQHFCPAPGGPNNPPPLDTRISRASRLHN
jgi:hypothetical protein